MSILLMMSINFAKVEAVIDLPLVIGGTNSYYPLCKNNNNNLIAQIN